MSTIIENIPNYSLADISAFVALIISILGTVISPLVSAYLTNRHALKLRKMDIEEKKLDIKENAISLYNSQRLNAITNFLALSGQCLAYPHNQQSFEAYGKSHFCIYQYVPQDFLKTLDDFYAAMTSYDWEKAKKLYPDITHRLSEMLRTQSIES